MDSSTSPRAEKGNIQTLDTQTSYSKYFSTQDNKFPLLIIRYESIAVGQPPQSEIHTHTQSLTHEKKKIDLPLIIWYTNLNKNAKSWIIFKDSFLLLSKKVFSLIDQLNKKNYYFALASSLAGIRKGQFSV